MALMIEERYPVFPFLFQRFLHGRTEGVDDVLTQTEMGVTVSVHHGLKEGAGPFFDGHGAFPLI